jgi:hypothetical protein
MLRMHRLLQGLIPYDGPLRVVTSVGDPCPRCPVSPEADSRWPLADGTRKIHAGFKSVRPMTSRMRSTGFRPK